MQEKSNKSARRAIVEWALTLVIALAIALPIRAYAFSLFTVKGDSMNDTLANQEVMFTTKYDYLMGDPARFDVVICRYPGRDEYFVKRVVGLPGDSVEIRNGYLFVNGQRHDEDYIVHRPDYDMPPYAVQDGEVFVLGDNRANSNDSHLIGPLKRDQIVAHVRSVLFPLNKIAAVR